VAQRNVYTYWDSAAATPAHAEKLRLFVRDAVNRKLRPRILTARNAARHPLFANCERNEYARLAGEVVHAQVFTL
jgi:hypothetical protein